MIKKSLRAASLFLFTLACCCAATVTDAQEREKHLISARAGGVNFVAGDVMLKRSGKTDYQRLSVKDEVEDGDAVRTEANGRVEVLLNPGSYFRVSENSEFELVRAALDGVRLKLNSGSAVVEATGYDGLDLAIILNTPHASVNIIRSGIYRFNLLPSGVTEVVVQKGRVVVGEGNPTIVKGGKVARIGTGGVEIAKLEKKERKERDALDLWSRERGKELAKANQTLSRRNVNSLLASARSDGLFSGFNNFASAGVWFWNGRGNCYTFLPFASQWRSPYGHWYDHQLGWGGFDARCNCRPLSVQRGIASGIMPGNPANVAPAPGSPPARPMPPPTTVERPSPVDRGFPRHKGDPIGDSEPSSRGRMRPSLRDH